MIFERETVWNAFPSSSIPTPESTTFCLALACAYSDRLDLRAVTTMGGNNHTDVTTQNALNILSLFRTDVPVARGADRYLEAEFGAPAAKCHGSNGVGNLVLPQSCRTPDALPAWDKLYEIAKAAQGELVLVTVAPLTNIALALQKHPDLPHWIKKIVMMGGSIGRGNITPYVEANAGHDPAATKLVFESGIPIDMVGLSITLGCPSGRMCSSAISRRSGAAFGRSWRRSSASAAARPCTMPSPSPRCWTTG